jgi:hypothetical protein
MLRSILSLSLSLVAFMNLNAFAQDAAAKPQRLLLLYQKPDGHPPTTHEYLQGLTRLETLLRGTDRLDVRLVPADEPWMDGPELLDGADGAVVFLSEGAKWLSQDPARLAAFERLAQRRGGLSCLHWGMGTKTAEPIPAFVKLFGGCHGGPDRKYKVLETELRPSATPHPITRGVSALTVHEEFYYALKWPAGERKPTPLMEVTIDGETYPVAWAWDRAEGGRSFGFSGLHFHANWDRPEYERLVKQGVLWTMGRNGD